MPDDTDHSATAPASLASLADADWLARLPVTLEGAEVIPLDRDHAALRGGAGPVLLVSFETIAAARHAREDQVPEAAAVADEEDWSYLTLFSHGDTWFRSPAVYAFFDRLIDEGYFDSFERVVFAGIGPGGYAAAAYSVSAPGATVIALQPQATLDPRLTGWDSRFRAQRRLCFTDRFGYAPDMTDGADRVFVLYDSRVPFDAMHAALFRAPHVTLVPLPGCAPQLGALLGHLRLMPRLLVAAGEGTLRAALVHRLWRRRREVIPYLLALIGHLESQGQDLRAGLVARNTVHRLGGPRPRQKLALILARLALEGKGLPPQRAEATQQ